MALPMPCNGIQKHARQEPLQCDRTSATIQPDDPKNPSTMNRCQLSLLLITALSMTVGAVWADTHGSTLIERPAVGPGMNAYYYDADPEHWKTIFERAGREVFDRRFEIVNALNITPGMRIADVGAGTGLYTMLFARAVGPAGRVYAVDISERFVEAIEARSAEYHVENVVPIVNHQRAVTLPPESVDLVFLADTYHHFEYPISMLASIHEALVPDGVLILIDFRRIPGISDSWILGHVRAGREQVIKEVEAAGFQYQGEPVKLRRNYCLRFSKLQ